MNNPCIDSSSLKKNEKEIKKSGRREGGGKEGEGGGKEGEGGGEGLGRGRGERGGMEEGGERYLSCTLESWLDITSGGRLASGRGG